MENRPGLYRSGLYRPGLPQTWALQIWAATDLGSTDLGSTVLGCHRPVQTWTDTATDLGSRDQGSTDLPQTCTDRQKATNLANLGLVLFSNTEVSDEAVRSHIRDKSQPLVFQSLSCHKEGRWECFWSPYSQAASAIFSA